MLKPLAAGLFAATALAAAGIPTFNHDIAPILYQNCAGCHRPGEVAPFALLTYQDAAKRAALIAGITKSRQMPPWKAEPGYGDFRDARRLTDEQLSLIQRWAKGGAPEGDPKAKPTPPTFADGWQLGQPSRVVTIPAKFSVAADGADQFRCFVIPLNLDHDIYVGATEFRADNRRVVHHALIYTDPAGQARKLAAGSPDGSYTCFGGPHISAGLLAGWAPGTVPIKPEPGYAATLRAGTDLVVQVHYHPDGKPEVDQSSLGLFFTDAPTKGRATMILNSRQIDIPPGESHYVVKTSLTVPADAELSRIAPHAHWLCKEMKITAYPVEGAPVPLIWIKDWDFNWQGSYAYAAPVKLPKGTRIDMEFTYDNSAGNIRNPASPPVRVTWGEETTNEMAVTFLTFSVPTPADAVPFLRMLGRGRVGGN